MKRDRMPKLSRLPEIPRMGLIRVAKAIQRLEVDQGERARRNARAGVTSALRWLKEAVDAVFPAPPRKGGKRTSYAGLTPFQAAVHKKRKLRTRGWVELGDVTGSGGAAQLIRACAEAGVMVKTLNVGGNARSFTPAWVVTIGPDPAKLRRARQDIQYRKALVVEKTLLAQAAQP